MLESRLRKRLEFAQFLGMTENKKFHLEMLRGREREREAQTLPRKATLQRSLAGGLDQGFCFFLKKKHSWYLFNFKLCCETRT